MGEKYLLDWWLGHTGDVWDDPADDMLPLRLTGDRLRCRFPRVCQYDRPAVL